MFFLIKKNCGRTLKLHANIFEVVIRFSKNSHSSMFSYYKIADVKLYKLKYPKMLHSFSAFKKCYKDSSVTKGIPEKSLFLVTHLKIQTHKDNTSNYNTDFIAPNCVSYHTVQ